MSSTNRPQLLKRRNASTAILVFVCSSLTPFGVALASQPGSWFFAVHHPPLFVFPQQEPFVTAEAPGDSKIIDGSDKLRLAIRRILSPSRFVATAVSAGLSQASDSSLNRGYGGGFDGYLKRFVSHNAFLASKDLVGTFALATLLDQDPSYQTSAHRSVWKRVGHALASSVVTRSTNGGVTVNASNLGGTAAAAGLANLWHARQDRGAEETLARFGFGLAADAVVRLFVELRGGSE